MNMKKILWGLVAVLVVFSATACRSNDAQATPPAVSMPSVSLPEGEGVDDLTIPTESTDETTESAEQETTEAAPTETVPEEFVPVETEEPEIPTEEPMETTEPDEEAEIQATEPDQGNIDPAALTYEAYLNMTPAEQQAHYERFSNLEDYIAWHNAAKEAYEESQNVIVATGPIDLGDYIEP